MKIEIEIMKNLRIVRRNLKICYKFVCAIVVTFMIGYWFYKFHKNEDISVIEYKLFKDSENTLYPELNFCVFNPFLDDVLSNISQGLNRRSYFDYLQGKIPANETYEKITYEEVTINFFAYLSFYVRSSILTSKC